MSYIYSCDWPDIYNKQPLVHALYIPWVLKQLKALPCSNDEIFTSVFPIVYALIMSANMDCCHFNLYSCSWSGSESIEIPDYNMHKKKACSVNLIVFVNVLFSISWRNSSYVYKHPLINSVEFNQFEPSQHFITSYITLQRCICYKWY